MFANYVKARNDGDGQFLPLFEDITQFEIEKPSSAKVDSSILSSVVQQPRVRTLAQ